MATDWIKQINDALDALGVYPDMEACVVQGNADVLVLEDAQDYIVYHSPEGLAQFLSTLERVPEATDQATCARVVEALWRYALLQDEVARVTWHEHAGYCWS